MCRRVQCEVTQRKEPLTMSEKGVRSENTLNGNEICTMTAYQINGLYKIFCPTTPGWGREDSCNWNKSAQCIFINVATSKGRWPLCAQQRKLFPHCLYLWTPCTFGDNPSFRAAYNVQRTGSEKSDLGDPSKDLSASRLLFIDATFQCFSNILPFLSKTIIYFLSVPLIVAWPFNKHNFP